LRLTLLYTAVTILSFVILFALTFFSLYRTLQVDDLQEIRSRLLGYWAQYQTGGIDLLEEEVGVDNLLIGERPFFVRVATRSNETLFFSYPRIWESFNVASLEMRPLEPASMYILSSPDYDYDLEVAGIWLAEDVFLQIGMSSENRTRLLALFQRNFLLISVAILVVGVTVGFAIASRALRPISRLTGVAQTIVDTGRLDARVERGTGSAELTQLVDLINTMLERIGTLVASLKNTVDMVAHDLRTPVTRLRARAELALRNDDDSDAREALVETVEQSDEILRMVATLLDITEAESGVMNLRAEEIDVRRLLNEVADIFELIAEERSITIRVECESQIGIVADRIRIRQAISNLADNAIKFSRPGGTVRFAVLDAGDSVSIAVEDEGVGLDEIELDRVWERMYRGPVQPQKPGLGLGLSFVRAIVHAHGGSVGARSRTGAGTTFTTTPPKGDAADERV
jgi:signal transduction histidine kinase